MISAGGCGADKYTRRSIEREREREQRTERGMRRKRLCDGVRGSIVVPERSTEANLLAEK